MTTFTLQDLTPEQQVALNNHEEMHKMFQEIGTIYAGEGKTSVMDEVHALGQTIADNTRLEAQAGTLDAPEPQPTLTDIVNNICTQLQLLATVINTTQGNSPNTTPPDVEEKPSSNESLQECVALTLQQAEWFRTMVRHELIGGGIEDLAKDAVQEVVESEVESYFENNFDPSYHFDFDDAVHDAVGDRIDDVVSDKIDDALDSYMSNATITINK